MSLDIPNGGPKNLPGIVIGWDAETQAVHLQFAPNQFKTWGFVIGVLQMALDKAIDQKKQAQQADMMRQIQEQEMDNAIRKQLSH